MDFTEEIKSYTDEELDLIISTQRDLYTEEEMAHLLSLQAERKRIRQEEHESLVLSRLPSTIVCGKCDAPNPFSNNVCDFCGCTLNKSIYYTDGYYEQIKRSTMCEINDEQEDKYKFHRVISILIPMIGLIVGAIMLASDNEEKQDCGKTCIMFSIITIIVCAVISTILIYF